MRWPRYLKLIRRGCCTMSYVSQTSSKLIRDICQQLRSKLFCPNKHLKSPKVTKGNIPWKFYLQILVIFRILNCSAGKSRIPWDSIKITYRKLHKQYCNPSSSRCQYSKKRSKKPKDNLPQSLMWTVPADESLSRLNVSPHYPITAPP